jgi:hypothetical protein
MTELAVVRSIDTPVASVVEALETHLAAARRGEYVSIAVVVVYPDGSVGTQTSNSYRNAIRGALSLLLHRLCAEDK